MGFSEIAAVYAPLYRGPQAFLSWESTLPAGTYYQVYVDRKLAWDGTATSMWLPTPPATARVTVGSVGPGEEQQDFSAYLPATPTRRARLTWSGGTYEGQDIAGFRVYGSSAPGGAVDYSTILGTVTAYPAGLVTDGFGLGGFGLGGFGESSSSYSWTSAVLTAGIWAFAVAPFDAAGNQGSALSATVAIECPPRPPAWFSDGTRVHYSYNASGQEATLTWQASPGP